ncbi:MAG: TlpA disulfide reductase family protein [Acidobacteriota bacterium]
MKRFIALCVLAASIAWAAGPVPRPVKGFRIQQVAGNPIDLSQQKGRVVAIQFLYTTCGHCMATAKMLSKIQDDLGSKGLQVLGVAFNEEALANSAAITKFVSSNGITFPVGFALRQAVMSQLGLPVMSDFVVPQIMVIDRKGAIRAQSKPMGSAELQNEAYLREYLGNLLKESPRVAVK